jgi:hypothetical protein
VDPEKGYGGAVGFKNKTIGVVPYSDSMLGKMHDQFFITVCKETLYFRCFINLNVSQQNFVLYVPDLKFFSGMGDKQMRTQRYLKYIIIHNHCTGLYHEKLFCSLDTVECDGSLVAVADTGIPIIVGQVLYYKFLTNIYYFVHIFTQHV